ncbi:MAG TPA: serine hydrolase, partial [Gammaproteobacteria bacterium]|nr:serine hydrolase [Gammaproteobacteria bacterium]
HEFDSLMSEVFKQDGPGAVALVMKDDKVLYRKAFGMANLELEVKMKPDHIFRIGSITKQFTASAILKLRDEGKLSLDDEITEYIEDYPTDGNKITIKHLLTHTSGIKSYTDMEEWDGEVRKRDFTPLELIDYFKNQPMNFNPGEQWKYNNSGYVLLGYIIEVVSGMSYSEYIENNIFKPLGMSHSLYGSTSKIIKNRASGYDKREDNYINADFLSMTQPYAAGSLLSTVDDLYIWYKAVMEDKVISESSRKEAHTPFKLNDGSETSYGYGWSIGNIQGSPMITHGGGINGFLTDSIYLPNEKVFVAVFSNCICNSPNQISMKMAAHSIGKPFNWTPIDISSEEKQEYVAVYESKNGQQRVISLKDGQLYSLRSGGSKFEIYPYDKDKFFFKDGMSTLHFIRDEEKQISSVLLSNPMETSEWRRTDKAIPTIERIDLDSAVSDKYLGQYELVPGFILTISKEDDKIFAQATGQSKIEIIPTEINKFSLVDVDAQLTFNSDENGEVVSLTLHQGGDHEAKKIE